MRRMAKVRVSFNMGVLSFEKEGTLDSCLGGTPEPGNSTFEVTDEDGDAIEFDVTSLDFELRDEMRVYVWLNIADDFSEWHEVIERRFEQDGWRLYEKCKPTGQS